MTIPVQWQQFQPDRLPGHDNTAFVIQHGGTFYVYVNTGRAEAERRFQAQADEGDGPAASGMESPFADEFMLWANAGEQLQAHADKLLRGLLGGH